MGGTCLNVGCIPSKALLDSSHMYHDAKENLKAHGIGISKVDLDIADMMERKNSIVKKLTYGISGLFVGNKVDSIVGTGKVLSKGKVEVYYNMKFPNLKR